MQTHLAFCLDTEMSKLGLGLAGIGSSGYGMLGCIAGSLARNPNDNSERLAGLQIYVPTGLKNRGAIRGELNG